MNEPKIIDRGTAAKLWAEGDDRVATKHKEDPDWESVADYVVEVFRDPDYEFALIPPEPEIVKPVVFELSDSEDAITIRRRNIKSLTDTAWDVTIRPQSQQAERDRLEREFVERCEGCFSADPKIRAYADFIKKEMG